MRLVIALLACGVGLAAQTPASSQAPRPASASISGRVVSADTGAVVRAAIVWLMTPTNTWTTTTDPDGRFTFPQLTPGDYTLKVMKPGFVPTDFGDPKSSEFGGPDPIRVADGVKIDRGDVALPRGGVIAGRIFDGYGDPVEATVTLLRRQFFSPGQSRLVGGPGTRSNDLGEFRLYGLMPGTYYLGVALHNAPATAMNPPGGQPTLVPSRWGVAPTYYPGTSTAAEAWPIKIAPGQDVTGITVTMQNVPLAKVSGSVTTTAGSPAAGVVVMAQAIRSDAVSVTIWNQARTDETGQFTLANLPPGEYRIDVGTQARPETPHTAPPEFASVPVSIAGRDLDGLDITLTRGYELRGRVVTEGDVPLSQIPAPLQVHTMLAGESEGFGFTTLRSGTAVAPDGTFLLKGVLGRRLIRVGFPTTWTLKHVRTPAGDITDEGLDVRGDVHGIEILLTPKVTRIDGTAKDTNGFPVRDALVVVFSADARRWMLPGTRYVRSASVDSDGDFSFRDLPSGSYFAAAIGRALEATWADPEFLERLKEVATLFTLSEGEAKTLNLVRKR
jgi:protocatechuate 3,4-dioxygenase beta subunit